MQSSFTFEVALRLFFFGNTIRSLSVRSILLTFAVATVFNLVCIQRIFKRITEVLNRGLGKSSCCLSQIVLHPGIRLSALKAAGLRGWCLRSAALLALIGLKWLVSLTTTECKIKGSCATFCWNQWTLGRCEWCHTSRKWRHFFPSFLTLKVEFCWLKSLITSWWQDYTFNQCVVLRVCMCVCDVSSTHTEVMPDSPYRTPPVLQYFSEGCKLPSSLMKHINKENYMNVLIFIHFLLILSLIQLYQDCWHSKEYYMLFWCIIVYIFYSEWLVLSLSNSASLR